MKKNDRTENGSYRVIGPDYYKYAPIAIERDKQIAAKKKENYEKYGHGKGMEVGIAYRMGIIEEVNITSESEKNAFIYGLYECANLQLSTMIQHGFIPERVKKQIIKRKLSNKELPRLTELQIKNMFKDNNYVQSLIDDILEYVGKRDAYDENIIFDELPEIIKNNEHYLIGYNKGISKGGR